MVSILDDIENRGLTPAVMQNVLLVLCRTLFQSASTIRDSSLKTYVYSSDESETRILIEDAEKFKKENLGQRPGIFVKFLGASLLVPSMMGGKIRAVKAQNLEYRAFIVTMGFDIHCVGRTPREALLLGSEIFFRFAENSEIIRDKYSMDKFNVKSLSAVKQLDDFAPNWSASVRVVVEVEHETVLNLAELPSDVAADYDIG